MRKHQQDVSSLFRCVGLNVRSKITTTEHTYEIDARHPRDNWLYPAFRAFQILQKQLQKEGRRVRAFTTIGTGQGVDAIGAYFIFRPRQIILIDIHPNVIVTAEENVLDNTASTVRISAYTGNLCQPLRDHALRPDLIYAKLPNIPFDGSGSLYSGQLTATFFSQEWIAKSSRVIEQYLLGQQQAVIREASACLASGGSLVLNLGARVPIVLVQQMFTNARLKYQELYTMFKIQSQPEWVLGGYARAEKRYGVTFDFYRFDAAKQQLGSILAKENLTAEQLKKLLKPFHLSATDALKQLVYQRERIGHLVQVIRGIRRT
ncbi:MAG: hypothetical protein HZB10_01545 [Candidatus Yonathbacteria bacterium]|nr:hypothetical protein [Candidatus Yonathbacteria bacterium]